MYGTYDGKELLAMTQSADTAWSLNKKSYYIDLADFVAGEIPTA
ncbi:hypothetical protein [Psittacicella hinzii]|nr:hypothetical protein [Psittacicella hinzii]